MKGNETTMLRDAILDAKYIDMISLAEFVVRDLDLGPEGPGRTVKQSDMAAAIFRWAVSEVEG